MIFSMLHMGTLLNKYGTHFKLSMNVQLMELCACRYNDCRNLLTYFVLIMTTLWGEVFIWCDDQVVVIGDQDVNVYFGKTTFNVKQHSLESMIISIKKSLWWWHLSRSLIRPRHMKVNWSLRWCDESWWN